MNNAVAETLEAAESRGRLDPGGLGRDSATSLFLNMVRGEAQMQCLTRPESPASFAQRDQWAKDAVSISVRFPEDELEPDSKKYA